MTIDIRPALGLVGGYLADVAFGDPHRRHPVAAFGTLAAALERRTYRDSRLAGAVHASVLFSGVVGVGVAAEVLVRDRPVSRVVLTSAAVWACLGGTTLARTGLALADALDANDLPAARAIIPSLCGRDPALLDDVGAARAALESVAENTSDAATGVLFWTAVAGIPGAMGYRAVNTLDAMIGYRSPRYENFGWFAAKLDDVVNLIPARVTGLITAAAAPTIGGSPVAAMSAWRSDASAHPSPNAGVCEASAAGALGVRLGGETAYEYGVEQRPVLGTGRAPGIDDLRRAVRLSVAVQIGATAVSALAAVAIGHQRIRVGRSLRGAT